MSEQHLCRDCGKPMDILRQELLNALSLTMVTCNNRICSLWSVTLSVEQYSKLTEAEWDTYRQSVANVKQSLSKLGGL